MMAPENIAIASNFTGYMNAIRGSDAFMDEALKNDPSVVMPEEYADRLRPNENCSSPALQLRHKVSTRLNSFSSSPARPHPSRPPPFVPFHSFTFPFFFLLSFTFFPHSPHPPPHFPL